MGGVASDGGAVLIRYEFPDTQESVWIQFDRHRNPTEFFTDGSLSADTRNRLRNSLSSFQTIHSLNQAKPKITHQSYDSYGLAEITGSPLTPTQFELTGKRYLIHFPLVPRVEVHSFQGKFEQVKGELTRYHVRQSIQMPTHSQSRMLISEDLVISPIAIASQRIPSSEIAGCGSTPIVVYLTAHKLRPHSFALEAPTEALALRRKSLEALTPNSVMATLKHATSTDPQKEKALALLTEMLTTLPERIPLVEKTLTSHLKNQAYAEYLLGALCGAQNEEGQTSVRRLMDTFRSRGQTAWLEKTISSHHLMNRVSPKNFDYLWSLSKDRTASHEIQQVALFAATGAAAKLGEPKQKAEVLQSLEADLASEQNSFSKEELLVAIGNLADERALPNLKTYASGPDPRLARRALGAMRLIPTEEAEATLVQYAAHPTATYRDTAIQNLLERNVSASGCREINLLATTKNNGLTQDQLQALKRIPSCSGQMAE